MLTEERKLEIGQAITYGLNTQVNSASMRPSYYFLSPEKMIQSWTRSTKVESAFINNYGIPMGMELEVERRGTTRVQDSNNLRELNLEAMRDYYVRRFGHYDNDILDGVVEEPVQLFTSKGDPSLNNGIEFVSQPMTLDMWQMIPLKFEEMTHAYAGYHRRTTGLHIHIPKGAFGERHLYLWLLLMQTLGATGTTHRRLTNWLSLFGQRNFNRWARFEMPVYNGVKNSLAQVAIDRVNQQDGRYKFVNFEPSSTIEMRFFKANLQTARILKNLELLDATYEFTKKLVCDFGTETPVQLHASEILAQAKSTQAFVDYIETNSTRYHHLLAYYERYRDKFLHNTVQVSDDDVVALENLNDQTLQPV